MRKLMFSLTVALLLSTGNLKATQSSGGNFAISKQTIDSGGGRSVGGGFTLTGIIGQPDAQPAASGGVFRLSGGFLNSGVRAPRGESVFADGFEQPTSIN